MRSKPPLEMSLFTCAGHGVIELAFGLLVDELRGDFAEGFDVGAPVVDLEEIVQAQLRNMWVIWSGRMGVCVPMAGRTALSLSP